MKKIILLITILCLAGCEPENVKPSAVYNHDVLERAQIDDVAGNNEALRNGERAFEAGVPANANPYQGANGYTFKSRAWLAGWIEASEKAKQND